jgi:hypothetical protein
MLIIDETNGSIVIQQSFGGSGSEDGSVYINKKKPTKIRVESNSKSPISGNKTIASHGGYDFWMVELDASNFLATEVLDAAGATISVYPNPFTQAIIIDFKDVNQALHISLTDQQGKIYYTQHVSSFTFSTQLSLNELATGIYFFSLQSEDGTIAITKRIMKTKL